MKNSGHNKIRSYVGGLAGQFWLIKRLIFVLFKIYVFMYKKHHEFYKHCGATVVWL